jgi:hypothetical protein
MCGYSAYTAPNAGPEYKWSIRTLAGEMTSCLYENADCTGPVIGGVRFTNSGACVYSGCTKVSDALHEAYGGECNGGTLQHSGPTCTLNYFGTSPPLTETLTRTTRELTGGGCDPGNGFVTVSGLKETLSAPDTIEAAISRATFTEGTSCCAVTGIIGSTTAQSTAPMSVGESTSVILDIRVINGPPSTSRTVKLFFLNYVNSTSVPLGETTAEMEVTFDGGGVAELEYDMPQPEGDRRRCLDAYALVPL